MARGFLFLQGPHGPFFAKLGARLKADGADVVRVNFSGGDWLDWHGPGTLSYRGSAAGWPAWIAQLARDGGITDLVLYGDCRPLHRAAIDTLKPMGVEIHVLEEGYFRPNWITCEKGGVNGHTLIPKDPDEIIRQADELGWPPANGEQVGATTAMMVRWCLRHYAARWLATPCFPKYRTHRPANSLTEALSWIGRLVKRRPARRKADAQVAALLEQPNPFFLLGLQLDSDAQIRRHSRLPDMAAVLDLTLASFANHAPTNATLVVKNHPLDNGLRDYARLTADKAEELGIADRVIFLDGGRLPPLLAKARGLVVVNSTAGLQALHHGCPTLALGDAIYAIPGLVSDTGLDDFWRHPIRPDRRLYRAFRAVVMAHSQHNGGFYTEDGMTLLVPRLAAHLRRGTAVAPPQAIGSGLREAAEMLDELLPLLADLIDATVRHALNETLVARQKSDRIHIEMLRDRALRLSNDLIRASHAEATADAASASRMAEICGCAAMVRRRLVTFPVMAPSAAGRQIFETVRAETAAAEEITMLHRLLQKLRDDIDPAKALAEEPAVSRRIRLKVAAGR
jgi:capsular polysaccharide export protein